MTHADGPPDEQQLVAAKKRDGRNDVIRNTLAALALILLIGWVWNLQGDVHDAKVLAAAGAEQFEFCQKIENRNTPSCNKPIVNVGKDGPTGPRGPRGFFGIPGQNGQPGRDGLDGRDGKDGPRGAEGPQGPVGAAGADGAAGQDGTDGNDGAPGPACPDGFTQQVRTVTTPENGPEEASVCIKD